MLGSLLIQPQMLARMQGRGVGDEMADEIVAIAHQLCLDPAAAEAVLPAFQAAGQRFADALVARLGPRLPQALNELRGLIEPVTQPIASLATGAPASAGPASTAELLERLADGLERLAPIAGLLTDAQIRSTLQRAQRILTDTLGLSQAGFRADFLVLLGEVRAELRTHPEGASAQVKAVREAFACLLSRLERDVYPRFPTLDLDLDRLAGLLIRALRETPLPAISGLA